MILQPAIPIHLEDKVSFDLARNVTHKAESTHENMKPIINTDLPSLERSDRDNTKVVETFNANKGQGRHQGSGKPVCMA